MLELAEIAFEVVLIYLISFVFEAKIFKGCGTSFALSFLLEVVDIYYFNASISMPLFLLMFSLTPPPSPSGGDFNSPIKGGLSIVVDAFLIG